MKRTEKKQQNRFHFLNMWTILSGVTVLLCLICAFGLPRIQNGHNVFCDLLIGDVAYDGTNRTGEWHLFWGMLFLGSVLTFFLSLSEPVRTFGRAGKLYIMMLCGLPVFLQLFVYGKTSGKIVFLTAFTAVEVWLHGKYAADLLARFICIYFAVESVAVILAVGFSNYRLGDDKVLFLAMLFFCVGRGITQGCFRGLAGGRLQGRIRGKKYLRLIQLLLPFLLLSYLKDCYNLQGTIVKIPFPQRYVFVILLLIITLFFGGVMQIRKKDGSVILFPTVFSVFAFVSYMPPALIMQSDLHHHGEQILAWQQIVELGQKAYADYSPASGLFPMVTGFFNSVLLHGQATEYAMSFVLSALLFEGIIMWLLYRRLGGTWSLFVAVLFHMPEYCRTWILLPVLLILSDKKLIVCKVRWFLAWVLCSFFSGLYYPLFGAALLIGSLPFGIVMLVEFVRKREWNRLTQKDRGWKRNTLLMSVGLLGLIAVSIPLLYRMLTHVLSMADQTVNVDGKSIVGYAVPEWFMPYAGTGQTLTAFYYVVRFVLGIVFVLIAIYLFGRLGRGMQKEKLCTQQFYMLTAAPIVVCFCYTYTMVCMDESWVANILSRSAHVILFVSGMFGLVILKEHGAKLLSEKGKNFLIAGALSVPFLFFFDCGDYAFPYLEGRTDDASGTVAEYADKLLPYVVKDGYVLITDELASAYPEVDFEKLGTGLIGQNILQHLQENEAMYRFLRGYDSEVEILGFEHTQFYYFLLNEKAVYSGRTAIAKSRRASKKVMEAVDTAHTVVRAGIVPLEQYYLYRYLMENNYVYCKNLNVYMPASMYQKIYGINGSIKDSPWAAPYNYKLAPASLAASVDALEGFERLTDVSCQVSVHTVKAGEKAGEKAAVSVMLTFDKPCDGSQAEFLYVDIAGGTFGNVTAGFPTKYMENSHASISCDGADGKLLLPLGANAAWYMQTNSAVELIIEGVENPDEVVVREMVFYNKKE